MHDGDIWPAARLKLKYLFQVWINP